ncbi:hypothetical protein EYR38_000136 [Pleurotus pulmonarius]|nr:hypothetical protein EYR38_000136 [Pleurotus pulmonarius]
MFVSVYIAAAFIATCAHGLTIDLASRQAAATNGSSVSTQIHPYGVVGKCLNVKGDAMANGTPVELFDCNGSVGQNWSIVKGQTKVQLAGTNFCLDAGSGQCMDFRDGLFVNNNTVQTWKCTDNNTNQVWSLASTASGAPTSV